MQSELKAALEVLDNAISVMDLNAPIADEDVKLWSDVINASKELKKVIENESKA